MFRRYRMATLCGVSLTAPLMMAAFGIQLIESENSQRNAHRTGGLPAISGIERSDDYVWHSRQFHKAAHELIAAGRCTEAEIDGQGGFQRLGVAKGRYVIACAEQIGSPFVIQIEKSGRYSLVQTTS